MRITIERHVVKDEHWPMMSSPRRRRQRSSRHRRLQSEESVGCFEMVDLEHGEASCDLHEHSEANTCLRTEPHLMRSGARRGIRQGLRLLLLDQHEWDIRSLRRGREVTLLPAAVPVVEVLLAARVEIVGSFSGEHEQRVELIGVGRALDCGSTFGSW